LGLGLDYICYGNKDEIGDFMPIPKEVQDVYNDPAAIKVLATRSGEDLHVIPLGSLRVIDANTIVCASIHMREAHENLRIAAETGARISTLAVKSGPGGPPQAYQVRCRVKTFVTSGPFFEGTKEALKKEGWKYVACGSLSLWKFWPRSDRMPARRLHSTVARRVRVKI
jgi:hypothetical protein